MVVQKLSISLSAELATALRALASQRHEDVSRLVETLLREHWLVAQAIQVQREPARISDDPQRLQALGKAVDQLWNQRAPAGRVEDL